MKKAKFEVGMVKEVTTNGLAKILVKDQGTVEKCANCNSGSCIFSGSIFEEQNENVSFFEVEARDPVGVKEGDFVQVEFRHNLAFITLVTFGVPTIAIMVGVGVGYLINELLLKSSSSPLLEMGMGGFFLLLSLSILFTYNRNLSQTKGNEVVINRIMDNPYAAEDNKSFAEESYEAG